MLKNRLSHFTMMILISVTFLMVGCQSNSDSSEEAADDSIEIPTTTPKLTATPEPTKTLVPTATIDLSSKATAEAHIVLEQNLQLLDAAIDLYWLLDSETQQESLEILDKLINEFPPDSEYVAITFAYRANIHRYRAYDNPLIDLTEAETDIQRALEIAPESGIVIAIYARILFDKGQESLALENIDRAMELSPGEFIVYLYRGYFRTYGQRQFADLAVDDFRRALEMKPEYNDIYYYLGDANFDAGQFQNAINNYSIYIYKEPTLSQSDPWLYYFRGIAYEKLGDLQNALKNLNQAMQIQADAGISADIGDIYLNLNQDEEAIEAYTTALELNFIQYNRGDVYFNRALAHDNLDHYEEAFADFEEYLDRDQNDNQYTRYACDRINALQWYIADNILSAIFGRPCNRFPFEYSSQTEYENSQENCRYVISPARDMYGNNIFVEEWVCN